MTYGIYKMTAEALARGVDWYTFTDKDIEFVKVCETYAEAVAAWEDYEFDDDPDLYGIA